jgi:hypothetical protein
MVAAGSRVFRPPRRLLVSSMDRCDRRRLRHRPADPWRAERSAPPAQSHALITPREPRRSGAFVYPGGVDGDERS